MKNKLIKKINNHELPTFNSVNREMYVHQVKYMYSLQYCVYKNLENVTGTIKTNTQLWFALPLLATWCRYVQVLTICMTVFVAYFFADDRNIFMQGVYTGYHIFFNL